MRGLARKAGVEEDLRGLVGVGRWSGEAAQDDPLDALDVHEVEGQGAPTCFIESLGAILLAQAQELLGLAQARPREVPRKQPRHEAADARPLGPGLADHAIDVAHGVVGAFGRIVGVDGAALALFHARMGGDDLVIDEDADELRVTPHPDLLAHVASGGGVEGFLELHVVIGMDLGLGPGRRIVGRTLESKERRLLHRLEDLEGTLARGAVDPEPRGLAAPTLRFALDVIAADPCLAAEETFADILHLAFDVWFSRGMADDRGIDGEATVGRVLGKGALEEGVVAVGFGDRRLEIVEDHAAGDAAKELPSCFEAGDPVGELLRETRVDELVPAVHQGHDPGVQVATAIDLGIPDQAELAEVHLGHLTRTDLGKPHRDPAAIVEAAVRDREAVKRAVGDLDALASEELVDLGEPQASMAARVRGELRPDRIAMRPQPHLTLARWHRHCPGPVRLAYGPGQGLVRLGLAPGLPAQPLGRFQPTGHGGPTVARGPSHAPLRVPAVNSA